MAAKLKITATFDDSEGGLDEGKVMDDLMFNGLENIEMNWED